jgi:hypothetical protein
MFQELDMTEKPRRGRPPSGRKTVVQIGLEDDDYAALEKIAEAEGESISWTGRRLLTEAIEKASKRRGKS